MYQYRQQQTVTTGQDAQGVDKMFLTNLAGFPGKNPKVRTFAHVQLKPGEEVPFHIHTGEFESYYILSGAGVYSDNDDPIELQSGLVTFTPSGSGHGIRNTGSEMPEFIALIVLD